MRANSDYCTRHFSWTVPFCFCGIVSRVLKEFSFEILAVGATMALYCANRFYRLFDCCIPLSFAQFYFGDLCGGTLFPAYVNLVGLVVIKKPLINSFKRILILELICSIAWEVIAPLVLPRSTGDALDVLAYFCGGLLYFAFRRLYLGMEISRLE